MRKLKHLKAALVSGASAIVMATSAFAADFNIPSGDLATALDSYTKQTGVALLYPAEAVRGTRTKGARGELSADAALARILTGTGFTMRRDSSGLVGIVHEERRMGPQTRLMQIEPVRVAAAATAGIESVVVTSSKIKGDIQTVPIAITALSQEQLTSRQIAGGPDLVKEVPNLTFTKTNFSGYSIQIRGIGTQAISVATDPAVAVALNDMPFIRNHFFEQEFYDVNQVEILRGPQGTLYGRNATAGVVNVISAKPTDQFEAMLSADIGNFHNRRYEGMVNVPIVDDRLDIRAAAEWTKRDGYTTNGLTGSPIDGRDLWSTRVTIGFKPSARLQAYLVWEHFGESDDRLRSSKQLCKTAPIPATVDGVTVPAGGNTNGSATDIGGYFTQGCLPAGLYDKGDPAHGDYGAFGVPNGFGLPYVAAGIYGGELNPLIDPYSSTRQSTDLRVIESTINPRYQAKNDTLELNADFNVTPELTFSSQTGYNQDFLWSTQDYNRFNTSPGIFHYTAGYPNDLEQLTTFDGNYVCNDGTVSIGVACAANNGGTSRPGGTFCDPQLGCSDRLVAQDLSEEHAWQLSQEFRLASNFSGPLNFSIGGNYLHYETEENYYVFINALTIFAYATGNLPVIYHDYPWQPGVTDGLSGNGCLSTSLGGTYGGYQFPNLNLSSNGIPGDSSCMYIDPNPIGKVNDQGHNYFLSQNPYTLNSYAGFGEVYYQVVPQLKLVGGLRWTDDKKHFIDIPSEIFTNGYGYSSSGNVDQQWNQLTGRFTANWTPKLDFTDQTLVYGSFAHGYKAGGANPPGAQLIAFEDSDSARPIHPLTFKPEFIDAYELGTKNTLMDGGLTLNGDVFFYNYTGYQISRIVDRTAINDNFNATVKGAELEATYEPLPGLKFNFAGGYEDTRIKDGQSSVDLIDRTAGTPGWMVIKPFIGQASNCILPTYVAAAALQYGLINYGGQSFGAIIQACGAAYNSHEDPITNLPYDYSGPPTARCISSNAGHCSAEGPISGYDGYDPNSVDSLAPADVNNGLGLPPNNGEGFSKNLGGNELPNAPHFTVSLSGEYTLPVSEDWAATLHSDFYWQSQSFARVFNDRPYDKIRGYSSTNVALILTSASGWQVLGYVKNVFDKTAITGDFLNSDDSGLTTNVFLTDPRLYGVRVTKNW